jgi:hypothetical protein
MIRVVKPPKTNPVKIRRPRKARPERVIAHGRDEVGVISADEFRRLNSDLTGEALIAAMKSLPDHEFDIEPKRMAMPVRKPPARTS